MADQVSINLGQFFEHQWGTAPGQAYIATLHKGGDFTQYMLDWPRQKDGIVRHILAQSAEGKDVYYCPSLFVTADKTVETNNRGKTAATRANIQGSQVLWVDFDNNAAPKDWPAFAKEKGIPEPSLIIQSSVEGNQHVYWRTDFNNSIDEVEQSNRSLALSLGADRSGWDGNQLLRPPYTANYGFRGTGEHKGWYKGTPADVRILGLPTGVRIERDRFANLGSIERELLDTLQLSGTIQPIEEVLAFANWTPELYKQFSMTQDEATEASPNKRSGSLQALAYFAAEAGLTDEQIYAVVENADRRWDKYVRRSPSTREKILKDTIVRARAKIGYLTADDLSFAGLLGASATQITEVPKVAYSFEDFLNTSITLDWLVDDLMAVEGIGIITGQPGTGKTQLGIQFAIQLALGRPEILGWNNKGGAKKSLMVSLEMSHAPLKKFMINMAQHYPTELRDISKNFTVVPLGTQIPLNNAAGEGMRLLTNILSEFRPDVLFIDSMQKISSKPLTDEVGSKELLDNLETLRRKFGCAIYIVHHDRKRGSDPTKIGHGSLSDMYGSQYIGANVDWVLSLRKTANKGELIVDTWKNRLAEERNAFRIKRDHTLQYTMMGEIEDGDEGYRIIDAIRPDADPKQGGSSLSI